VKRLPTYSHRSQKQKTSSPNGHTIGYTAAGLNVLFWGIAPILIKTGVMRVPPAVFLYYRFAIVVALTIPFIFLLKKVLHLPKKASAYWELGLLGLISNPLNLLILFYGVRYTTSAASSIIAALAPMVILVGSALFLREKISRREIIGVFLALIGTLFVVLETPSQASASNPLLGNMLVLSYNIIWAMAVLWMKKRAQTYHPFLIGFSGWLVGLITCGLLVLFLHPSYFIPQTVFSDVPAMISIGYMAVFGSLVAFTAYQVAQKFLDASEVGILTYLQPVVTLPLSIYFMHEKIGFPGLVGIALLILGVAVAELHMRVLKRTHRK